MSPVCFVMQVLSTLRYWDRFLLSEERHSNSYKCPSSLTARNLEMQIRAAQYHLRILGISVDYRKRSGGVSKVSEDSKASVKAGFRIPRVLFPVGLVSADNQMTIELTSSQSRLPSNFSVSASRSKPSSSLFQNVLVSSCL